MAYDKQVNNMKNLEKIDKMLDNIIKTVEANPRAKDKKTIRDTVKKVFMESFRIKTWLLLQYIYLNTTRINKNVYIIFFAN